MFLGGGGMDVGLWDCEIGFRAWLGGWEGGRDGRDGSVAGGGGFGGFWWVCVCVCEGQVMVDDDDALVGGMRWLKR